ncbi:hypothetical protein HMPREF9243_0312 [Aerococcus sp. Group 1]|nr:hypothetical protein HMPREF9243_0312 [Aerococcus sp. Group 1]
MIMSKIKEGKRAIQKRQLKLIKKQIKQHKDVFIRLKNK